MKPLGAYSAHMTFMNHTSRLAILLISAALLTGCNAEQSSAPDAPASSPAEASTDDTGNVGGIAPYIGPRGVGLGVDLGGGLVMTPSGGLGIGF